MANDSKDATSDQISPEQAATNTAAAATAEATAPTAPTAEEQIAAQPAPAIAGNPQQHAVVADQVFAPQVPEGERHGRNIVFIVGGRTVDPNGQEVKDAKKK